MPNPNARQFRGSSLRFNTAAQRYATTGGKFLSASQVQGVIESDLQAQGARMQEHGVKLKAAAQQYKDGAIDQGKYLDAVRDWRDGVATEVKALHLGNVASAAGGFAHMDNASNGRAGQAIRTQMQYLSNFAIEAAGNPDIVLSLDKSRRPFDERVQAYAEAGRGTWARERHAQHIKAGFQSRRNDLEPDAAHCKGPRSCPAMTALGTVAIDDPRYITAGFRVCSVKCRCTDQYLMAEPNGGSE